MRRFLLDFIEGDDINPIFFFLLNRVIFSLNVNFDVSSPKLSLLGSTEISSISVANIFSVLDLCFSAL